MTIRPAMNEDLRNLEHLGREFHASSSSLTEFKIDVFVAGWEQIFKAGCGVIFLLMDGDVIKGTIGGVAFPDICHGRPVAQEFFFFVTEGARGEGTRLYREFERWAIERGCVQIRMGLLVDSMPEKLDVVYRRWGYRKIEVGYMKELGRAA